MCLVNVSAVSDVRAGGGVKAGRGLRARPIQPFGRGRPWLRRTRALCKFNRVKERCGGVRGLWLREPDATPCAEKLATAKNYLEEGG